MDLDRMSDLTISPLANGGMELSQQTGLDDPDVIELHPCQLRWIAECAGLLPAPDPALLDRLHARHTARIHALRDRIGTIRELYLDEILDRCGAGVEISLELLAISDLAGDLVDDLGTAPRAASVTKNSNGNSAAISVTPTKRGRPATGNALTDAERQAKRRAKQTELPINHEKEAPCLI